MDQKASWTEIDANQYTPFTLQFHGAKTLNLFFAWLKMGGVIDFPKFRLFGK